ncbi:MAG: hypothetical protein FWH21_06640, partial [Kiritimatiellaeota bacterium]|nr:hypothetical protein [Kiritimatiellota bacterium]
TLTGLIPGKAYELAFFNRPWSSDGNFTNRRMIISFDNGTARDLLTFNNECSLVHAVTWRYVAVGDSVTVALFNVTGTLSRHFYALTNEELPPTAANGTDLLPLLDLGSRPETIRNLSGAGTVTGDGTVPITLTGEITPTPVINFDGAVPIFDGAVLPVSLTGGHIHVVGDADFSGLSVIAAPDANLRGAKIKILSATGDILAPPQLDPPLRGSMRLEVSDDGHDVWLLPILGTILMIR